MALTAPPIESALCVSHGYRLYNDNGSPIVWRCHNVRLKDDKGAKYDAWVEERVGNLLESDVIPLDTRMDLRAAWFEYTAWKEANA